MAKTFLDLQNLRASKIELTASKILDVDLARFYNEVISDMSKYGQKLKKVTTNLVANQAEYGVAVLPGLIATAQVKVNNTDAPFINIHDYNFTQDLNSICHTVASSSVVLLPTPTVAAINALVVYYWGKLPEIIDAAVAGTSLAELDDKDWNVVVAGISMKMYEKLITTFSVSAELMPDANPSSIIKFVDYLAKRYDEALDNYGNQCRFFNSPAKPYGPAVYDNQVPQGTGRQDK